MLKNEFYMFRIQMEKAREKGCICREDRAYPLGYGHGAAIMDGGICSIFIRDDLCPVHSEKKEKEVEKNESQST